MGARAQQESLAALGNRYGTDKVSQGFTNVYSSIFEPKRQSITRMMEVGVFRGSSILMWRDYFQGATIVGVDAFHGEMGWRFKRGASKGKPL